MKRSYFKYIFGLLLFGSNGVIVSLIALSSYEIVLLRSLFGILLLAGLYFLTGHRLTAIHHKRDLFFIGLSGAAMAADWLFLFEAYQHIGVSLGVIINYCGPAIVMGCSPFLFGERLYPRKVIALAVALIGAILISGQAAVEGVSLWGLLCAGLSAVSYSAMVISNKLATEVEGMENAVIQLFFAFVTVAVFVGCKQGFYMDISAGDWLPILWLGLVNTGLGCYFYFSSIGKLPVQTVAICGYLEPLSAALFAAAILKETMLPLQIFGAILILGGAFVGELQFHKSTVAA